MKTLNNPKGYTNCCDECGHYLRSISQKLREEFRCKCETKQIGLFEFINS